MIKRLNKDVFFYLIVVFFISGKAQEYSNDSLSKEVKLFLLGCKQNDSGKYERAILTFKAALKIKKDYWEAHNKIGYAKIHLNDYKGAQKELDKADKIAPLNYETDKLKGINYFLNHQYAECKKVLDTAAYLCLEDKLEDAELWYYRARLMFVGKNYKGAIEVCETALEWKPHYLDIIKLQGDIRFARKEYNYAIKYLTEAIDLTSANNQDFNLYKLRAKSKFEVADYKGAIKDWNVYIDTIPDEEEALVSRAAAKINANDNSGAVNDLDIAIKLNPKNAVSWCYRGTAKGGLKKYPEALKDLDYALKLKFDYAGAFVNRAAIKLASRDRRGACEDLEKADALGSQLAIKLIQQYCK